MTVTLLVAAVAATVFLVHRTVRATRLVGAARVAAVVVTVALTAWAFAAGATARGGLGIAAVRWWAVPGLVVLAWLLYVGLALGVTGLVSLALRWADRQRVGDPAVGAEPGLPRRVAWVRRLTVASLVVAALVTGYGRWEFEHLRTNEHDYASAQLPASFDGFRIAYVSDLHAGVTVGRPYVARLVERVNAARPDLVVLGGDLVDGSVADLAGDLEPLRGLRATYGVVAVSGNHEYRSGTSQWFAYWRTLGIAVLDNDAVVVTRGGADIDVIGVNDRTGVAPHAEDLAAALGRLEAKYGVRADDTSRFRLLVAHQPRQALTHGDAAARAGVDLQLSGHTHGGQLWPLHALVMLDQPVVAGWARLGGVDVLTSRGVAGWGPPVRVGAPPEVLLVTLRRA